MHGSGQKLLQYVRSLGKELCSKKEFDIRNGLAVNKEKAHHQTDIYYRLMDRHMDGRTDGQTDILMDRASYRSA